MSPFFSILTASYNSGETIEKTIVSIQSQSFKRYEHIIVDGGSLDETLPIIEKHSTAYNLQFISEPDDGISDALNKALSISSGVYIVVIQSDDQLIEPNVLTIVHDRLRSQESDICSFPVIFNHPEKGNILRKPIKLLWWNRFKFIFPHQGTFVHRRIFDKIGSFRKIFQISLDYDFFYRALDQSPTIHFGDFPVALMGGEGIGTLQKNIPQRLAEDRKVQCLNEKNRLWRTAQLFFYLFYKHYKTCRLQF